MTATVGLPAAPRPRDLQDDFREVMARMCTQVSVVTAIAGGIPQGSTVSAFASLSMGSPIALISLDRSCDLLAMIGKSASFGLNVLGSSQSRLALNFARKGGVGKFANVRWDVEAEAPRLPGAGGFLACDVASFDVLILGLVRGADTAPGSPLTYYGCVFGTHAALDEQSARDVRGRRPSSALATFAPGQTALPPATPTGRTRASRSWRPRGIPGGARHGPRGPWTATTSSAGVAHVWASCASAIEAPPPARSVGDHEATAAPAHPPELPRRQTGDHDPPEAERKARR